MRAAVHDVTSISRNFTGSSSGALNLMLRAQFLLFVLFLALSISLFAKKQPDQVLVWPEGPNPVLRFTFTKFEESSGGRLHYYTTETTVENLWSTTIPTAEFSLYLFDKNKARIGEGLLLITNVGPHEVVKFQTGVEASGRPASMTLSPRRVPEELRAYAPEAPPAPPILLTVNSVPQGASLKIDGQPSGTTPRVVRLSRSKHTLEFEKPGFTPGKFPLELGPNDTDGGSVSFELGASAHDTIELRDGSILIGDLETISATEAVVRIGGNLQHLNRNSIKEILLTERDMPDK